MMSDRTARTLILFSFLSWISTSLSAADDGPQAPPVPAPASQDAPHEPQPADPSIATTSEKSLPADHKTPASGPGHRPAAKVVSPDEAQWRMTQGNQRFAGGFPVRPRIDPARRAEVAGGQHPFATVLTCADSRVAVERIFDQGIGDLFVVRVAGNVAGVDEIGTIEYGVGHLHTQLVVVMGHTSCGAVAAAAAGTALEGSIPSLIDDIRPAVRSVQRESPSIPPSQLAPRVVESNVWQSIGGLLTRSAEIREYARGGKVRLVGAIYDLETGKVKWLGPHPDEASLLSGQPLATGDPHAPAGKPASAEKHPAHTGTAPLEILQSLRAGNARFADGRTRHPNSDLNRLKEVARGQFPSATVIACSDSRVPVEYVFDQGIGDVFTIRVAGNVCDRHEIGSAEYAVGHLHTPVLVLLGHTACGAVTAVASDAKVGGSIPELVDNIRPAVEAVKSREPGVQGDELVAAAIRANVRQAIEDLRAKSPVIKEKLADQSLLIVGGVYDLATGRVEWIEGPTGPAEEKSPPTAVAGETVEADGAPRRAEPKGSDEKKRADNPH